MSYKWRLRVSESHDQGGRGYMEDFVLNHFERVKSDVVYGVFGVMDGHGGSEAADFVKSKLPQELKNNRLFWSDNDQNVLESIKEVYGRLQSLMWIEREKWPETINGYKSTAGTTATVVIIRNDTLYVGHVGDSGMVLASINDEGYLKSEQITQDHKPNEINEKKRIESSGGSIKKKSGIVRVVWNRKKLTTLYEVEPIPFLAVARSLGDLWSYDSHSSNYHVSPIPDVISIKLDPLKHRAIILASDGVWNVVSGDKSVDILRYCYKEDKSNPWNPAQLLVNYSLYQWKKRKIRADNVSAIVISLTTDNLDCEMSDFKDNNNDVILHSEILQNDIPRNLLNNKSEIISSVNLLLLPHILNKSLDDVELLRMFILSSETFARHCIPWRDDPSYWNILSISFGNLGIKNFPNFVSHFEHSRNRLEDLIMSFPWSIVCLRCTEDSKDFQILHEWPLLTDLWVLFFHKIITPNLCFITDQLTRPSIYHVVMKYILELRATEILNFINTNRGLLPVYTLKKSQSCNTGKLLYNLDRLCDGNIKQNVFSTRTILKRSLSLDVTKDKDTSLLNVGSFNSGSDTPPMSPANCDSGSKYKGVVNKFVRNYTLTKKYYGTPHKRKTFMRSTKRTMSDKKIVRFVMMQKSRTT